jgi:succinoglycan biosynthesis transport protein ExoP
MNSPRKTSSRSSHEKEAPSFSIDYDHFGRLCLRYWKWLAGVVALGAILGFIAAAVQTPIYAARATILVQPQDIPNGNDGINANPLTKSADLLKTFEQLLQSKDLPQRVIRNENLTENPDFFPPGATLPATEDATVNMLADMITIHNIMGTRLIDITVEHRSPQMAQMLANKLARESILQDFDQAAGPAAVLSDFLQKEEVRLQKKISDQEDALKEYRSSHKQENPDNNEDMVEAQLKNLTEQAINQEAQVTLLKERYGEKDPKLIQAEAVLEELHGDVSKAQEKAMNLHDTSIPYKNLQTDLEAYKSQLENVRKAREQAEGASHVEIPGISITEEASLPNYPVRPNKTRSLGMGAFVGLVGSFAFICCLYFVDNSLRTVSQAENTLGVPVIAAVPILTESDGKSVLPTYSDPQSFVAEAFRGLRASLLLHDREQPLKTILVASAIPGEGKSFCGANLAVVLAQAGQRTLLIDADLRLPTVYTYFDLPPGEGSNGFPDVLVGRSNLASGVIESSIPNLSLLLTTTPADAPAELLSGTRFPALLEQAIKQYDRIVIDSAPLNAVSDTLLIVQKVQAILLVVRASQTPANESKAALEKIANSKMKPLGIILNYLAAHTLKSYAYGYSYGQKPKEKNAK